MALFQRKVQQVSDNQYNLTSNSNLFISLNKNWYTNSPTSISNNSCNSCNNNLKALQFSLFLSKIILFLLHKINSTFNKNKNRSSNNSNSNKHNKELSNNSQDHLYNSNSNNNNNNSSNYNQYSNHKFNSNNNNREVLFNNSNSMVNNYLTLTYRLHNYSNHIHHLIILLLKKLKKAKSHPKDNYNLLPFNSHSNTPNHIILLTL